MNIFEKLISLVYDKNPIRYSNLTNISTRFGIYQVRAYKDNSDEYLAIMSRNFFDLKTPIVYIHSNFHAHSDTDSNIRYVNNEINSVLKMISSEGGLIIYHSKDGIESLLQNINAKKLERKRNIMTKGKTPFSLKLYSKEYKMIGFILQNLNLSAINLISHDINLTVMIEQLEIEILKRVDSISFSYGN